MWDSLSLHCKSSCQRLQWHKLLRLGLHPRYYPVPNSVTPPCLLLKKPIEMESIANRQGFTREWRQRFLPIPTCELGGIVHTPAELRSSLVESGCSHLWSHLPKSSPKQWLFGPHHLATLYKKAKWCSVVWSTAEKPRTCEVSSLKPWMSLLCSPS